MTLGGRRLGSLDKNSSALALAVFLDCLGNQSKEE